MEEINKLRVSKKVDLKIKINIVMTIFSIYFFHFLIHLFSDIQRIPNIIQQVTKNQSIDNK